MEEELLALKKKYESRRRVNSFYIDMGMQKSPPGSPNIPGNFSRYTYHIDTASKKLIRTELT